MVAVITQRIDELVKSHIAPAMKRHGFEKHGQRFTRDVEDHLQIVEVQRWKYNAGDHGKLSMDLGVFYPDWSRLVRSFPIAKSWDPIPKIPAVWCCHVSERLDQLCQEPLRKDWWWELGPSSEVAMVGAEIVRSFEEKGLPWLVRKSNFRLAVEELSEHAERFRGTWIEKILCMLAWHMLNDMDRARGLYRLAIEDEHHKDGKTEAMFGRWLKQEANRQMEVRL